tara:strand:+ start:363 stop:995 length:633 start_codon:yes stop_codon:yes gene_type:complete
MSHNRFSCLKPTNTPDLSGNAYKVPGRNNRFSHSSKKTNSRWQRSKSPEKNSRFPAPEKRNNFVKNQRDGRDSRDNRDSRDSRDSRDRPRYNKGGFGKFRYNHGRRGPSRFDNVKKDNMGRPMLANATTGGFDIGLALQKSSTKKNKKIDKKVEPKKEVPKLVPFKKEKELTEEQKKAEDDWNRQMILNMQWETDSEEEDEEEEDDETTN